MTTLIEVFLDTDPIVLYTVGAVLFLSITSGLIAMLFKKRFYETDLGKDAEEEAASDSLNKEDSEKEPSVAENTEETIGGQQVPNKDAKECPKLSLVETNTVNFEEVTPTLENSSGVQKLITIKAVCAKGDDNAVLSFSETQSCFGTDENGDRTLSTEYSEGLVKSKEESQHSYSDLYRSFTDDSSETILSSDVNFSCNSNSKEDAQFTEASSSEGQDCQFQNLTITESRYSLTSVSYQTDQVNYEAVSKMQFEQTVTANNTTDSNVPSQSHEREEASAENVKLNETRQESTELEPDCVKKSWECDARQMEYEHLERQLRSLMKENMDKQVMLETNEEVLENLKASLEECKDNCLHTINKEVYEHKMELDCMSNHYQNSIVHLQTVIDDLSYQLSDKEVEIVKLNRELYEANTQVCTLDESNHFKEKESLAMLKDLEWHRFELHSLKEILESEQLKLDQETQVHSDSITQLRTELEDVKEECDKFVDSNEKLKQLNKNFKKHNADLLNINKSVIKQLEEKDELLETEKTKVAKLNLDLQICSNDLHHIQKELQLLKEEVGKYNDILTHHALQDEKHANIKMEYEKHIAHLLENEKSSLQTICHYENQRKEQEERVAQLQSECNAVKEMQTKLQLSEKECNDLKQTLSEKNSDYLRARQESKKTSELKNDNSELLKEKKTLLDRIATFEEIVHSKTEKLKQSQIQFEELSNRMVNISENLRSAQDNMDQKEKAINSQNLKITNLIRERNDCQTSLKKQKTLLDSASTNINDLKLSNKKLKEGKEAYDKAISDLDQLKATLKASEIKYQNSKAKLEKEIAGEKEKTAKWNAQKRNFENCQKVSKERMSVLEKELEASKKQIIEVEHVNQGTMSNLETKNESLEKAFIELEKTIADKNDLLSQSMASKRELEERDERNHKLKEVNDLLLNRENVSKEKISDLEQQLNSKHLLMNDYDAAITKLKLELKELHEKYQAEKKTMRVNSKRVQERQTKSKFKAGSLNALLKLKEGDSKSEMEKALIKMKETQEISATANKDMRKEVAKLMKKVHLNEKDKILAELESKMEQPTEPENESYETLEDEEQMSVEDEEQMPVEIGEKLVEETKQMEPFEQQVLLPGS